MLVYSFLRAYIDYRQTFANECYQQLFECLMYRPDLSIGNRVDSRRPFATVASGLIPVFTDMFLNQRLQRRRDPSLRMNAVRHMCDRFHLIWKFNVIAEKLEVLWLLQRGPQLPRNFTVLFAYTVCRSA